VRDHFVTGNARISDLSSVFITDKKKGSPSNLVLPT